MSTASLLVRALLELTQVPPERREVELERWCSDHPEIAASLRAASAVRNDLRQALPPPPERIGPYEVIEPIGRGGMGVVYLARQHEPVERCVAIKLLSVRLPTEHQLWRFENERRTLARFQHPNIARLFDAGTTEDGQPYFVMELIAGDTLPAYCQRHALSCVERVQLLVVVCDAVQYAHARGVLHRDLKPENVLVDDAGDSPRPVVIDFGLARSLARDLDSSFATADGALGTPLFMSPEQATPGSEFSTATDVYGLGALLYVLLTGVPPFSADSFAEDVGQVYKAVRERMPTIPSRLVSDTVSAALQRDELDWITMKALAKDPADRYPTAEALSRDLRRFLANEPVEARPRRLVYVVRKLVARHRVAAISLVLAAGFMVIALATWLWSTAEIVEAAQREKLHQAVAFLKSSQTASASGDWNAASDFLGRAAALGYDEVDVAIERVHLERATWDLERADQRLAALRDRGDLGTRTDLVDLLYFDPTIPNSAIRPGWREVYRRCAVADSLPPEWRGFAEACMAETLPAARDLVEEVLRIDPRHRPAQELRVTYALLSGSPVHAHSCAKEFLAHWPRDPSAMALLALAYFFEGNSEAAEAILVGQPAELRESVFSLAKLHKQSRIVGHEFRRFLCEASVNGTSTMRAGMERLAHTVQGSMRVLGAVPDQSPSGLRARRPVPAALDHILQSAWSVGVSTLLGSLPERAIRELTRSIGFPTLRATVALVDVTNGDIEGGLARCGHLYGEADWVTASEDMPTWSVLVGMAALSTAFAKQQTRPEVAVRFLARGVRDALRRDGPPSLPDDQAVVAGAVLTWDPSLMREAAYWLRGRWAADQGAALLVAKALGHGGSTAEALAVCSELQDTEAVRTFRQKLETGQLFLPLSEEQRQWAEAQGKK